MVIDRSNYEIWIIDWLDGKLNDLQTGDILAFLNENPDLREEMEALSSISMDKPSRPYTGKDLLKKTTSEITDSQFEWLCIAHLEHDLNAVQEKELEEIAGQTAERKKLFEFFQKIKLLPPRFRYNKKDSHKKKTTGQITIQLSIRVLSAAATIALLITTYLLISGRFLKNSQAATEKLVSDTLVINSVPPILSKSIARSNDQKISNYIREDIITSGIKASGGIIADIAINEDSIVNAGNIEIKQTQGFLLPPVEALVRAKINYNLIAYNPEIIIANEEKDRSRLGKFFARTYRDLILKEKKAGDLPLKGYEFVEGGINGLNRLLGWEMSLQKTSDENGELKSFYFSSKLLKFNAPVKKADLAP